MTAEYKSDEYKAYMKRQGEVPSHIICAICGLKTVSWFQQKQPTREHRCDEHHMWDVPVPGKALGWTRNES